MLPQVPIFPIVLKGFQEETQKGEIKDEDRYERGESDPERRRSQKRDKANQTEQKKGKLQGRVFPTGGRIPFHPGPFILHGRPPIVEIGQVQLEVKYRTGSMSRDKKVQSAKSRSVKNGEMQNVEFGMDLESRIL